MLCLTDSFVLTQDHCVNCEAIRYESTSFNRIVADKLQCVKLESHDALCLTDSFVLTLDHCVNLEAIRYESTSFHRIVALRKAWVTRCALSDRFFCIHDRSLCEFQSDKIWVNKFQKNWSWQITSHKSDKLQCVKLESHDALCLTDSFVLTPGHCVNLEAIRYESTRFNRSVALRKAWVTRCPLSNRFFCIHVRSLCEFQNNKIWVSKSL